ncbi:hypothetical protein [Sphingomonas mollis]|nr:hypothetical protein [Sphingomonas sp. BT553]
MMKLLLAGLAMAAAPVTAAEHRTRIDHPVGPVDAHYRASVDVAHKQVGAVAPGGRSSSLRCHWSATVNVDRVARHAAGSVMARSISRDAAIKGSRPGWCEGQRTAISRDVAARMDEVHGHMMAVAREDHPVLHAELDRLHGARTG